MDLKKTILVLKHLVVPLVLVWFAMWIILPEKNNNFNEKGYDVNRIYKDINFLSSPELKGRLAGTPENQKLENYIREEFKKAGLKPVVGHSFDQAFKAQIPYFGKQSVFNFPNQKGERIDMLLYRDYRYYTVSAGGSIDYKGDLLYVGRNFFNVPLDLLKGKVVVLSVTGYSKDVEDRAIEAGVKGIFVYRLGDDGDDAKLPRMKSLSMSDKPGPSLGFAVISKQMAQTIAALSENEKIPVEGISRDEFVGVIHDVNIKQQIDYKTVPLNNLLGMIPGKNKHDYVLFSAHFDHIGNARGDQYFPGAIDNASGTAMLLEMVRWCKVQKGIPEKTIIFAAWNAEEAGLKGSDYYVRHPLVPLPNTENVNMDMLGGKNIPAVAVSYMDSNSEVLASKFYQYADSLKIKTVLNNEAASDHYSFYQHQARAVMINQFVATLHEVTDTVENSVSRESLTRVADLMGLFLKRDVYGDLKPDYFNHYEKMSIGLLTFILLMCYFVENLFKHDPKILVLRIPVEKIKYNGFYRGVKSALNLLLPFMMVVILVFLSQLPKDLNFIKTGAGYETNLSIYLILKKTIFYLRGLMQHGVGSTLEGVPLWPAVASDFVMSWKLLFGTIALALPLGVLKGMLDAGRSGPKKQFNSFGSMVMLSVPDVIWIFIANMLMIYIGNQEVLNQMVSVEFLRGWLMPWLTLSIMPFVYVSRVAYVACMEEKVKPYATALKARGYGKMHIFTRHFLITVLEKSVDSARSLTVVLISNMIVVEYLFDYKGLANHILLAKDQTLIITLVMALTALYFIMMLIFKVLGWSISPRKRQNTLVQSAKQTLETQL